MLTMAFALLRCSFNELDETRGNAADKGGTGGSQDGGGHGGVSGSGGFPNTGGLPSGGAPDSGGDAKDAGNAGKDANDDAPGCGSCVLAHATTSCVSGQCVIASCDVGFDDCDKSTSNGCETALGANDHCSSCSDVCSAPTGTTACVNGACKVTACPTHRADCDGLAGNGCEADLTTSATCADCNTQCVPGIQCSETPAGNYICACASDAACLNGGTCYLGFCICGGNPCAFNQRCTLVGTCF